MNRLLLLLTYLLVYSACHKNQYSDEKVIKQGDTYETGAVLPELRSIKNDTAWLALYPSAQVFFLDMKLKNSEEYVKAIRSAEKKRTPVRAKVFKHSTMNRGAEVAEILPPTAQDLAAFKAAMRK